MPIVDVHREWLLIGLRIAWAVGGVTYPAGRPAGDPVRRVPRRAAGS